MEKPIIDNNINIKKPNNEGALRGSLIGIGVGIVGFVVIVAGIRYFFKEDDSAVEEEETEEPKGPSLLTNHNNIKIEINENIESLNISNSASIVFHHINQHKKIT